MPIVRSVTAIPAPSVILTFAFSPRTTVPSPLALPIPLNFPSGAPLIETLLLEMLNVLSAPSSKRAGAFPLLAILTSAPSIAVSIATSTVPSTLTALPSSPEMLNCDLACSPPLAAILLLPSNVTVLPAAIASLEVSPEAPSVPLSPSVALYRLIRVPSSKVVLPTLKAVVSLSITSAPSAPTISDSPSPFLTVKSTALKSTSALRVEVR